MVYTKEAWIEAVKKTITDLNTDKPTSGLPTAIATIRYMRDGLLADNGFHLKDGKVVNKDGKPQDETKPVLSIQDVRESFAEIIGALSKAKSVDEGFASNASAAAKAAGFKGDTVVLNAVSE